MAFTPEMRAKSAATKAAKKAAAQQAAVRSQAPAGAVVHSESAVLEEFYAATESNRLASDVEAQSQTFEERLLQDLSQPVPEVSAEVAKEQQAQQQSALDGRDDLARDMLRQLAEERQKVEEFNKRARLSGKAFGGQPLGPVSSMMQAMRQDDTAYRNADGSVPWNPGDVPKWFNVRDAQTHLETNVRVKRAASRGYRPVLDEEGRMVRNHDCVLMVASPKVSALNVARGMQQASEAGKRGAQTADEWEVMKSRQAGFVSGGLHRMNSGDDPFPALGPNELLIG